MEVPIPHIRSCRKSRRGYILHIACSSVQIGICKSWLVNSKERQGIYCKKVGTKIKISGNIRYYSVQMQSVKVNLRKANGTVWKTVTLGKGGYLKLPSVSNATGYTFMGWSKTRRTGSSTDPDYEAGELLRISKTPICMRRYLTVHWRRTSVLMRWLIRLSV